MTTLTEVPAVFSTKVLKKLGLTSKKVAELMEKQALIDAGGGFYFNPEKISPNFDRLEIATFINDKATLCLDSALKESSGNLLDTTPLVTHIAIPRGTRIPEGVKGIKWHFFDRETFNVGVNTIEVANKTLRVYSTERSLIDYWKYQRYDTSIWTAIKRYKNSGGTPSRIREVASKLKRIPTNFETVLEVIWASE